MNNNLSLAKKLKSQLSEIKSELSALNSELNIKQKEIWNKKESISKLESKIKSLEDNSKKDLTISEHAILRYLERVIGLDLKKIENEIITNDMKGMSKKFSGNLTYSKDNINYIIKDNVILTIHKNGKK